MNVVAIVQARYGSTRFPKKVLADLGGQTMIDRVLAAASRIEGVSQAVVAWAEAFPAIPEADVLARYAAMAANVHADVIVRLTGDCPLFDPQVGTLVLQAFHRVSHARIPPYEYVSNVYPKRTWPDGLDCEVFLRDTLDRANELATDPIDREHVTRWMHRNCATYNVELPVDWSTVRLTVDTEEDAAWIRECLKAPRSGRP